MLNDKIALYLDKFKQADLTEMSLLQRLGYNTLSILWALARDMKDGQLSLRAMSLVYTTLITLVPLLAFSFSVLKGFDVHNKIKPMLSGMFEGLGPEKSAEVTERVVGFVDNIQVGVLGVVGFALLLYAVIALMQKIESAFNFVWRVQKSRSFARRFGDYLSVIFVAPLLLFLSAGLTTAAGTSQAVVWLNDIGYLAWIVEVVSIVIPWVIMAFGFAFIYSFMPNTRVKLYAALVGGLSTAFCWKLMGWLFATFIANSASYVAIYAAFATLIIFMVWLYFCWLVMLMGANISFYVQNPAYAHVARREFRLSGQDKVDLGLGIVVLIGKAFYAQKPIPREEELSERLQAPILGIQRTLDALERGGVLTLSGDRLDHYLPAVPLDQFKISDLVSVLLRDGHGAKYYKLPQKAAQVRDQYLEHVPKKLSNMSVYDALIKVK